MKYNVHISEHVDKIFSKLAKKNEKQFEIVLKKIHQIRDSPEHYKPLKGDMHGSRRVHIGHFVLVYEISGDSVRILDYDHHDHIY